MANVNKNRRRYKFQDRALFGYLEQNRRMEASVAQFFRSPCGGFVLGNQKVPYLETCNGETPVFSTTWGSLGHLLKQYQFWISVTNPVIFAWFCLKYYRSRWFCWKKLIFIQIWGITKHAARGSETSTIAETLSYTKEVTFNFRTLEVIDLIEILLLLYSRRIMCAGNESWQDYKALVSTSPVPQRLSLSSVLWTTASRGHFRINREQHKMKSPESVHKLAWSLWSLKLYCRQIEALLNNIVL